MSNLILFFLIKRNFYKKHTLERKRIKGIRHDPPAQDKMNAKPDTGGGLC